MLTARRGYRWVALGGVVLAAAISACGSESGVGGGGGGGSATVSGNVSAASTSVVPEKKTWLAWLRDELTAKLAYAADTTLGGIAVTATSGNSAASATTDFTGSFTIGNAPTGNLTLAFRRGNCTAGLSIGDVVDGSLIELSDMTFGCNQVSAATLGERFRAVLDSKSSSALAVCTTGGGTTQVRLVNTNAQTDIENQSGGALAFADLAPGDALEVTGRRQGLGNASTVVATQVRRTATGQTSPCRGEPVPTAAATGSPAPTKTATPQGLATVGPSPTPTTTATATPTP